MMSIRATSTAGRLLEDEDAVAAALGVEHLDVVALEHAGQRVDVADVVVDDQDLGAGELGQLARLGQRRPRSRVRGPAAAAGLRLGLDPAEHLGRARHGRPASRSLRTRPSG